MKGCCCLRVKLIISTLQYTGLRNIEGFATQNQGNEALKRGMQLRKKFYLREAVGLYTRGLDMRCRCAAITS